MQVIDELYTASFKGVEFRVPSESVQEMGRKIVLHDYPNSSKRIAEDLGRLPATLSIQAYVHGSNYREWSKSLESVLNEKGSGTLILPNFGTYTVTALPYSKRADQRQLGKVFYRLSFTESDPLSAPSGADASSETVYDYGDSAREAMVDDFIEIYEVPEDKSTFDTIVDDLEDSYGSVYNSVSPVISDASSLASEVQYVNNRIIALVKDGSSLANSLINRVKSTILGTDSSIVGIFQSVSQSISTTITNVTTASETLAGNETLISSLTDSITSMLGFGSSSNSSSTSTTGSSLASSQGASEDNYITTSTNSDYNVSLWDETTESRSVRNSDRLLIVDTVRTNMLVTLIESAAAVDYTTATQVQNMRTVVENAFEQIITIPSQNTSRLASKTSTRNAVTILYLEALTVLKNKEKSSYNVLTDVKEANISAAVLAYNLYANSFDQVSDFTDMVQNLRTLNIGKNSAALGASADVLQDSNA